jgi:hypothetical protein
MPRLGSLDDVARTVVPFLLLLIAFSFARAQDQESKLVERLLKPDMTLQNTAQNKKFIADGASINKQATVGTFYFQEKSNPRSFSNTREFSARQFNSGAFQGTRAASGISSQQPIGNSQLSYSTRTARVRGAHDADKAATSRTFAENRPFLVQGKSQKALNRKNAPLTIEQVRELLNKNK